MSESDVININLPELYTQINTLRQARGLSSVDTGSIGLQINLRFTVLQRRHLNLKQNIVKIDQKDAAVLNNIIEELFNVRPLLGNFEPQAPVVIYELPLTSFYEAIDQQRRLGGKMPVDNAIIAVRLGVKFLIVRRRILDFKVSVLQLDKDDIWALEQILQEQFAITLPKGIAALCDLVQPAPTAKDKGGRGGIPHISEISTQPPTEVAPPTGVKMNMWGTPPLPPSWFSSLLQRFSGYGGVQQRRYLLDVPALLLTVAQQRAAKGYKHIPPIEMQRRYRERLTTVLRLTQDQDPYTIALTKLQFSVITTIVHKEFDILIPELDIFASQARS